MHLLYKIEIILAKFFGVVWSTAVAVISVVGRQFAIWWRRVVSAFAIFVMLEKPLSLRSVGWLLVRIGFRGVHAREVSHSHFAGLLEGASVLFAGVA